MSSTAPGGVTVANPGSKTGTVGTAIAGMLLGPPLIGYISHAFNLRISFILFAFSGMMLIPVSLLFFRHQRSLNMAEGSIKTS